MLVGAASTCLATRASTPTRRGGTARWRGDAAQMKNRWFPRPRMITPCLDAETNFRVGGGTANICTYGRRRAAADAAPGRRPAAAAAAPRGRVLLGLQLACQSSVSVRLRALQLPREGRVGVGVRARLQRERGLVVGVGRARRARAASPPSRPRSVAAPTPARARPRRRAPAAAPTNGRGPRSTSAPRV